MSIRSNRACIIMMLDKAIKHYEHEASQLPSIEEMKAFIAKGYSKFDMGLCNEELPIVPCRVLDYIWNDGSRFDNIVGMYNADELNYSYFIFSDDEGVTDRVKRLKNAMDAVKLAIQCTDYFNCFDFC